MKYVMNERKLAEEILNGEGYGDSFPYTTTILAKYYKSLGYGNDEIKTALDRVIDERVPSVKKQTKDDRIRKALKISGEYPLYETEKISVSTAEMDKVRSVHSGRFRDCTIQKAAFTLVCFAKFLAERGVKDNWVNAEMKDIFSAAGLKLKTERQRLLMHELYKSGFIAVNPVVGKFSVRVLCESGGDTVAEVDNVNEAGLIFEELGGKRFVKCETCGRRVRVTNGRSRFCRDCAVERDRMLARERSRAKREKMITAS